MTDLNQEKQFNCSSKMGFSFGTTSGVITTLGLIISLTAGEASHAVIVGGILTIAVADAFSDSLGIHVAKESEGKSNKQEIRTTTLTAYFSKLIIALTFILPQLFFNTSLALIVSIAWGIFLLAILSFYISSPQNRWRTIAEHLLVGIMVIVAGFLIGRLIKNYFN